MTSENRSPFDPSRAPGRNTLWDLPFDTETAQLIVIPVPWEVTVTFRTGTARGPEAIPPGGADAGQ